MHRIAPIFSSSEMEQITDFQYRSGLNTKAGAVKALVVLALEAINSPCFRRYCQVNKLSETQAIQSLADAYKVFDNMAPLEIVNHDGRVDPDIIILKRLPPNGTIAK